MTPWAKPCSTVPAQAPSPTASAVVGDILSLSEQISRGVAPLPEIEPYGHNLAFKPMDELQTKYYVRLKVADRVGALSETVDIFAKHNISISLINQVEDGKSGASDTCSVIFLTHRALEKDVQAATAELASVDCVAEVANVLRIEDVEAWTEGVMANSSTLALAIHALRAPVRCGTGALLSCPKHNGRAHLREPLIGNAGYRSPICKHGRFSYGYAVLRMSARDERKYHVARGQEKQSSPEARAVSAMPSPAVLSRKAPPSPSLARVRRPPMRPLKADSRLSRRQGLGPLLRPHLTSKP